MTISKKKSNTTKKRGGPITKARKEKILIEIADIITSGQIRPSDTELSKRFKVTRKTINNYVTQAYNSIPSDNIENVYIDLKSLFIRMRDRLLVLWDNAKFNESSYQELKILKEIRDLIKDFTDLLERYHVKPKAVDYVAVQETKVEKIEVQIVNKR